MKTALRGSKHPGPATAVAVLLAALGAGAVLASQGAPPAAAPGLGDEVRVPAGDGFLAARPELRFFAAEEHDRLISEQMLVRMAYTSLEAAIRRSGAEIDFELADFETLYRERFDNVLWSDVITLAPPVELQIAHTEVFWNEEKQGASWEPRWEPVVSEPGARGELLLRFGSMTLAEIFASLTREHGMTMDDVAAVTRYSVVVEHGGRRESYKAAFFWHAAADGRVSLTVEDPVTQRIGEALVTTESFDTKNELLEAGRLAAWRRDNNRPQETQ
jgi:hypothetical protein